MGVRVIPLRGGARLVIEVNADSAIALLLQRKKALTDIRPFLEDVARIMREAFGRDFAQGGIPPWKPLALSTIAAKTGAGLPPLNKAGNVFRRLVQKGNYGSAAILIASGALRDSYRQQGARGHIERIDVPTATVSSGSSLPYARAHQKGTPPYTITAKLKKALAFTGGDGETILRRAVQHPGLPKRAVTLDAQAKQEFAAAFRKHLAGNALRRAA